MNRHAAPEGALTAAAARRAGGARRITFPLVGAGGEPVDLRRTFLSHGVATLPPMRLDRERWAFEVTVALDGARPRTVTIGAGDDGNGVAVVAGANVGPRVVDGVRAAIVRILRLDEDLSDFYARASADPELAWAASGAGRMIRSQTVFEEIVKTVCTTNCAWSATVRMVGALVEHLGAPAVGAPPSGPLGRAFPTPEAMAAAGDDFYRDVVRAGYRGRYLVELAESVASGRLDLEALGRASPDEVPDDELEARLLALPGVGPYAAAHVMLMLGRYSRLILDSWTRPTYVQLTGGRPKKDATIVRRFRRYGRYAGLAFWLFLTRDWVED